MKVCVVGAGSLGCLFAAYLSTAGVETSIIARGSQATIIKARGIKITKTSSGESFYAKSIRVLDYLDDPATFDFIILAVKAFDVQKVLENLESKWKHPSSKNMLILIQNGIGVEDSARSMLPEVPIVRLTTTNGALLEQPGHVFHTGAGGIYLGFWDEKGSDDGTLLLDGLSAALISVGLQATVTMNMRQKVWEKAIINAGINPVGAIFKVPNGRILAIPELHFISEQLTSEALAVGRACKAIDNFDGHAAVQEVLERTSLNKNSMLQDLDRGRQTEVDFINGAIVRHGKNSGILTPWNDTIVQIVHGFEALSKNKENLIKKGG